MSEMRQYDSSGDFWPKPRRVCDHFTPAEIEAIREAYFNREPVLQVAERMQCARRTITRRYEGFRDMGCPQK